MAQVAEVLDDLIGRPVTPGAVNVLAGRQCDSGEPCSCRQIAVPGGDTARQDALNDASVEVCGGLRGQAEFLVYAEELEVFTLSTADLSVWMGACSLLSPEVHDQHLRSDVEGEVISLEPLQQVSHLLPIGSH